MKNFLYLLLSLSLILFVGCGDDDNTSDPTDNFDRQAMLRNLADQYIIPGYQAFTASTNDLVNATTAFTNDPNTNTLDALRNQWISTYNEWQRVSMLEVGRADQLSLRNNVNVYPIDAEGLQANLEAGTFNLELPSNLDKQGFGAIDYLLYGIATTSSEVVAFYNDDNYKNYLNAISQRINELATEVLSDWENGFRDEFVNNDGSSANAAVDQFTNNFVFYYEKALRAGKVGIPAGVFSGSPLPTHVEAPYYGQNRQFLITALDAFSDVFNGRAYDNSATGQSYRQYLEELQAAKDGTNIAELINAQLATARTQILTLNEQLQLQVESDNIQMLSTYDELQRNVVLLKVDMMQALSISVSYVDADGD